MTSTNTDEGPSTDDDREIDMVDGNDKGNKTTSSQEDDDENHADVSDMEMDEAEPPRAKTTRYCVSYFRALDKRGYCGEFKNNFSYFSMKTYVLTTH